MKVFLVSMLVIAAQQCDIWSIEAKLEEKGVFFQGEWIVEGKGEEVILRSSDRKDSSQVYEGIFDYDAGDSSIDWRNKKTGKVLKGWLSRSGNGYVIDPNGLKINIFPR